MGTRIYGDDGTTTVAVPMKPDHVAILSVDALVGRYLPDLIKACRMIDAVPIAGESPQVLSEREMRAVDPGAPQWRPGHVWLAVPVVHAPGSGSEATTVVDLTPDG